MRHSLFGSLILVASLLFFVYPDARACTIWASTGDTVKGGGTLIAKNRDNAPNLETRLATVFPARGWKFFGILDIEEDGYVVAAVNEKGLAVVNASANSVPPNKRHVATEDLTQKILVTFDSVDSILKEKDFFKRTHPAIYIIADAQKIMSVEVAPGGNISIKTKENGTIAFTNHFTSPDLIDANEKMNRESLLRLRRINELCKEAGATHTFDDFIKISRDTNNSRPGAIMRKSKNTTSIRTLATFIMQLEKGRPPRLYVQLMNPGQKQKIYRINPDKNFWGPIAEN